VEAGPNNVTDMEVDEEAGGEEEDEPQRTTSHKKVRFNQCAQILMNNALRLGHQRRLCSDDLDETDGEKEKPATKKRKLGKASLEG